MLKSYQFIQKLATELKKLKDVNIIEKFLIRLSINQQVSVIVVSNEVSNETSFMALIKQHTNITDIEFIEESVQKPSVSYEFLTDNEAMEEYDEEFTEDGIDYGLRRSLNNLFFNVQQANTEKNSNKEKFNLVTFYSYKGGVGRTTGLALAATYLARKGKKVFVIDCDFEAPGLINFFNVAQSDTNKNGLVEYLNDCLFEHNISTYDYIYEVEKTYSGSGNINLMPAGNILSNDIEMENLQQYMEGLARIDLQSSSLTHIFRNLLQSIQKDYSPDVILVDSRTGFNNIFGTLAKLSNLVVVLAGDDIQNTPGTEYVSDLLKDSAIPSCFVLSILSSNFSKRFAHFKQYIQNTYADDANVFYFDRQNTLEFIGTPLSDEDDLKDFISGENGSVQYHRFFEYLEQKVALHATKSLDLANTSTPVDGTTDLVQDVSSIDSGQQSEHPTQAHDEVDNPELHINSNTKDETPSLQDRILLQVSAHLPDLYAENITDMTQYMRDYFYIRPCMEDFFVSEKTILLGDKGTGKTAFYQALKQNDFFKLLIEKTQRQHLNFSILNITNHEQDQFELIGLSSGDIKNELIIRKLWILFIWNALVQRGEFRTEYDNFTINLGDLNAVENMLAIANNDAELSLLNDELIRFNTELRKQDRRLIITFDRLDNIVKPSLWNDIIAPLIKLCMHFPHDNIRPKLFLRRDLFERLGNLTNKNSFKPRSIDLEWSRNEVYSFFLKVVFTFSEEKFYIFLGQELKETLISEIKKKFNKKNVKNQLPLEDYLIEPVINTFFGESRIGKTAYEYLYRNIQNSDKTVNLRPFLDLLKSAIKEQKEKEKEKRFRGKAIIGLRYCTSSEVRKKAVERYLQDLWSEQGNELVKLFCEDFANNEIPNMYKRSWLDESKFESLLGEIKNNHLNEEAAKSSSINDFKQILIANKIINPYMVGSKRRYGIAFLYTSYLGV